MGLFLVTELTTTTALMILTMGPASSNTLTSMQVSAMLALALINTSLRLISDQTGKNEK